MLSSQNLELAGLRVDLGASGLSPGSDVDRLLDQLGQVIEAAAGLGAPLVCVEVGPLPEPPHTAKTRPAISADEAGLIIIPTFTAAPAPEFTDLDHIPTQLDPVFVAQVDGALAELGTIADRHSVIIAFRSELSSFAALQRILTGSRCQWFGIDLDPVAMLRDSTPLDELFSNIAPFIRHVRGRDALVGTNHRTKPAPIGKGATDWPHLLANLHAADYHGWITIDPTDLQDRAGAAEAGLKFISAIGT